MRKKWNKLRKWQKRWAIILTLFAIFLLTLPFLMGIWFKSNYTKFINTINAEGNIHIQVLKYKRVYWHSYATLRVQITDPYVKIMLGSMNIDPAFLDFTIDQNISHGPLILYRGFYLRSGLASIRSTTRFTSNNNIIMEDNDVVTLTGNYVKYFSTHPFDFVVPPNYHVQLMQGVRGVLRIFPREERVSGVADLVDFKVDDADIFLSMPNISLRFNQYKSASDLWIGSLSILLSEISGHDSEGNHFAINGIDFDSDNYELEGKLNNMLRLDVDRLQFGGQPIGPLHMILSVGGLDIAAIKNMNTAYHQIMTEGERYESQLNYKISMLLPLVFSKGASIELSTFSLDTPIGPVLMQGIMNWPKTDATPPSDIEDLIAVSNAHASIRVSKSLTDKILNIASYLPFFRDITPEIRRNLLTLQSDVEAKNQQNFLTLSYLANQGLITEDAGLRLLNLQRNDVPLEVYTAEIKDLLLKKQIVLVASYWLSMKYSDVVASETKLDNAVTIVQNSFSQNLRNQLVDWLNKGYISGNKDDYVIYVDKKNEKMTLNGKEYQE